MGGGQDGWMKYRWDLEDNKVYRAKQMEMAGPMNYSIKGKRRDGGPNAVHVGTHRSWQTLRARLVEDLG